MKRMVTNVKGVGLEKTIHIQDFPFCNYTTKTVIVLITRKIILKFFAPIVMDLPKILVVET